MTLYINKGLSNIQVRKIFNMIIEYNEIYSLSYSKTYITLKTKFTAGRSISADKYDTEVIWMEFKFNNV